MKKARKLALTLMSVLFALTFVLGLVACGGQSAKSAIDAYLLPQDNQLVDADFSLPKAIGIDNGVKVTWTSDNEAIKIEDGTADAYNAKVTLQEAVTTVNLTIASGSAKKVFTVRVDELSVYTFINHYGNDDYDKSSFPQRKTAQSADFKLDASYTIQDKTAPIVWKVKNAADEAYVTIGDPVDGVQTAKVKPGDDVVKVTLTATFTYKGVEKSKDFEISISPVLAHRQSVVKMYSEANFPIEFDGYVVHVYVAEDSERYGLMATFFAVDSDFCCGYYIWQAALESKDDIAKVVPGAHFTFSGDYAKNYNGLWETNGYEAGTAVFDGVGNKTAAEMEANIRAYDAELISGVESAKWQMSRLVSLTGWQVKSAWTEEKGILTLQNGDTTIDVSTSSYVTTAAADMTALKEKLATFAQGSYVNIKGILGYNSGYRLQPRTADDITAADAAGTNKGAALKNAYKAVSDAVAANGFNSLVTVNKPDIQMPVSDSGVTVSYKLARHSTEGSPVAVDETNGKISVTPGSVSRTCLIEVTYKDGDVVLGQSTFSIRSWLADDQQIVDEVTSSLNKTRISAINAPGEYALPEVDAMGATITWTIGDADNEKPEWANLVNGKLVIDYLPADATSVKVYANVEKGTAHSAKPVLFNVKVSAAPTVTFKAMEEAEEGAYKLAMYSGNKKMTYYATGAMTTDGYYFATTLDVSEAADFVITQNGSQNQYTIKVNGKFLEFAPRASGSSGVDIKMNEKQTEGKYWQWIEGIQNFVFESAYNKDGNKEDTTTDLYYFGNYSSNTSMSGNYIGRIANAGDEGAYTPNNKEGVDQWVAHFGTLIEMTNEKRAEEVLAKCEPAQKQFTSATTLTLFTTGQYDADIDYSLSGTGNAYFTLSNNTLAVTIPAIGSEPATVTLHISVTVGEDTAEADYVLTAKPLDLEGAGTDTDPFTVEDALTISETLQAQGGTAYYKAAGETNPTRVYITGYITKVGTPNYYSGEYKGVQDVEIASAADGTTILKIRWIYYDDVVMVKQGDGSTNPLHAGDQVVVWGYLESYNGDTATVYSYSGTYPQLTSWTKANLSNEDKAKDVANAITFTTLDFYSDTADVDLPTTSVFATEYGATIAWALENEDNLKIVTGNKLHYETSPTGEDPVEVDLTVTVTVGTGADAKTAQKTFTIKVYPAGAVAKVFKPVESTPVAGDYYIGMQVNGTWYYLTGEEANGNDYQLATTTDASEAAKFTLTVTTGGFTIQCENGKWLVIKKSGGYNSSMLLTENDTSCVWVWEADYKTFSVMVETTKCFLGNYGTRTGFMNSSEFGYLDGTKTSANAQYPARIGTFEQPDDQDKAEAVLGEIPAPGKTAFYEADVNKDVDIAVTTASSSTYNATITWSVSSELAAYVTIDNTNGKLKITSLPDTVVTGKLTVTVTVGTEGTATDQFDITLNPAGAAVANDGSKDHPFTVAELKTYLTTHKPAKDQYTDSKIYVKGYVSTVFQGWSGSNANWFRVYIVDDAEDANPEQNGFLVYKLFPDTQNHILERSGDLSAGSEIVVYGYIKNYNDETLEYDVNGNTKPMAYSYTDVRTADQKLQAALEAVKTALEAEGDTVTIDGTVETLTLPASAITNIDFTYAVSGNGATLAEAEGVLTFTHTAAVQTATLTIKVGDEVKATLTLSIAAGIVIEDGEYTFDITTNTTESGDLTDENTKSFLNGLSSKPIIAEATATKGKIGGDGGGIENTEKGVLKFGTSSADGSLAITFAKPVTKIVITAQGWSSGTNTLDVNGVEVTLSATATAYMFEFVPTTNVTITFKHRGYISKIVATIDSTPWTDDTKITKAKGVVSATGYIETEYERTGEFQLPTECFGATIAWSVKDGEHSDIVTISAENSLMISALPTEANVTVTLVATISCGAGTAQKVEIGITIVKDTTDYGTSETPLTVEQALAIAQDQCATNGDCTRKIVYVKGVAENTPGEKSGETGTYQNLTLVDETKSTVKILVYEFVLDNAVTAPAQHDVVVICGYITRYKYNSNTGTDGTIEFSKNGNTQVTALSNTRGQSTITVEAEGATVTGITSGEKAENGTTKTFTVQVEAGRKLVSVVVGTETLQADGEGDYTITVLGDVTVKVTTVGENEKVSAPVATLSFGTGISADSEKVNTYTTSFTAVRNGVSWTIAGFSNNNNAWSSIRAGRKKAGSPATDTPSIATITTTLAQIITSVEVTFDSGNSKIDLIKSDVQAFKLQVCADDKFETVEEYSVDVSGIDLKVKSTFEIPEAARGANKHYRIVVDTKGATSSNGYFAISSVVYNGYAD